MPDTNPNTTQNNGPSEAEKAYMDKKAFPLSTQPGLSLHGQRLIDAVNKDELREMRAHGETLNAEQEAIWLELEAKSKLLKPIPATATSAGS